MRDRLLAAAGGLTRLVLVVAAFGIAVGSIGLAGARGFCAEGDQAPAEEAAEGACPDGAQRCLPPLISSILIIGDAACHDQAADEVRSILVPAFVGSTVLLAGAWYLRPSRTHARDRA